MNRSHPDAFSVCSQTEFENNIRGHEMEYPSLIPPIEG